MGKMHLLLLLGSEAAVVSDKHHFFRSYSHT